MVAKDAGRGKPRWPLAIGAMLGAMPFWLYEEGWIAEVSAAGYVPFAIYLSLYCGLFVLISGSAGQRLPRIPWWISAAVVWIGLETLRADVVFDGYPWYLTAQPLVESFATSAMGAWIGLAGVSAVLGVHAAAVAHAVQGSKRPAMIVTAAILLAGGAAVVLSPAAPTGTKVTIASVQTNVPQSNKMRSSVDDLVQLHADLITLTRVAAEAKPDVIAWPETMRPGTALMPADRQMLDENGIGYTWDSPKGRVRINDSQFAIEQLGVQKSLGIPILIGEDYCENLRFSEDGQGHLKTSYDKRYNSVFLVRDGEVTDLRYDKIFRTPFGETMPWIRAFPKLEAKLLDVAARGMRLDLASGKGPVVFPIQSGGAEANVATPICFEVTVASLCRQLCFGVGGTRRADVMVNVTNDGWFGGNAAGKAQHLQLARWRCVELATPMVRAANTGISAAMDSRGRMLASRLWSRTGGWKDGVSLPPDEVGVLVCAVPGPGEPTLYSKTGNLVGVAGVGGLLGLILILGWCRFGKR